jgi:hypothetical protein
MNEVELMSQSGRYLLDQSGLSVDGQGKLVESHGSVQI